MTKERERRDQTRYEANCQCWIEKQTITLLGTAINLSKNGFFLQTLPLIETGAEIDIKMEFQDIGKMEAVGTICWRNTDHKDKMSRFASDDHPHVPGMGIKFSTITSGKKSLLQYLDKRAILSREM